MSCHVSPVFVGANVIAVESLAIGEADGPDGALAVPMTFLTTKSEVVSIATL